MDFDLKSGTLGDIPGGSLYEIDEDHVISSPTLEDITYEPTQVILFKKVPYEATEMDIVNLCRRFGVISDVYLLKSKGYAFVQFQLTKSAVICYDFLKLECPQIKGEPVFVFYTGKREIYKQENGTKLPSRYLLLLFSTNSEFITNHFVNKLLGPFGRVMQAKLIHTNPPSAFVEMEDIGAAITIKGTLNNTVYANSFKITVGYTTKPVMNQPDQGQYHFSSLQHISSGMPTSLGELYPPGMNIGIPRSEGSLGELHEVEVIKGRSLQNSAGTYENLESHFRSDNKGENTLLVKNLPIGMTCMNLFKLFGMYGNVMKVKIFYTNPENALVELQDNTQANVAKVHLNNCCIRGNNIFVTVSKNPIIFNVPFVPEGNKFLGDYTESKEHRYKIVGSKNFRNIAPPSPVLHLSNLCDNKDDDFYRNMFKNCGRVKKFMMLKGDTLNMLMEMENTQQAVEVLVQFHNFNIEGKFLKVSFSKYQTIKD